MIDAKEHFYDDDPGRGHPDVRTVLKDAAYFFLGNGAIQAAVQFAPGGEGTPLGLLIMDPERLGKKREALTMDAGAGLEGTMISIIEGTAIVRPGSGDLEAGWEEIDGVPVVRACWEGGDFRVVERFFCPDASAPMLRRDISLSRRAGCGPIKVRTGLGGMILERSEELRPGSELRFRLRYELNDDRSGVKLGFVEDCAAEDPRAKPGALIRVEFGDEVLDRFFRASVFQLPAVVSRAGRLDGSIWQYNREWVRDQAVVAASLAMIGEAEKAGTMFTRHLEQFVTSEGDTVDSSERRDTDEVELDQNGFLLNGLKSYVLWSGDLDIVRRNWDRITAAAEFPLRPVFRHEPSGLLVNRREFWERHRIHGIETGLELAHQVYVSAGLASAALLAGLVGEPAWSRRWDQESRRIRRALLEDRAFRLVDNRGFIKRRGPDGRVQETITASAEAGLPSGVPLRSEPAHYLNPDTSAALPLALGLVRPDSPVAVLTLASLETLWNQAWEGGGHGRYHFTSEPDSPGPWPFASLFIARAAVETGDFAAVRRILNWMNSLPGAAAGSWLEFYGRRLSPPFPQVGVIPWTWAEIIHLVIHHLLGVRPESDGIHLRPRLPADLGMVRAGIPIRGVRLALEIGPGTGTRPARFESDGKILRAADGEAVLEYPERDIRVTVR
jgi:hypothetical protein